LRAWFDSSGWLPGVLCDEPLKHMGTIRQIVLRAHIPK
jgi:hypothetical protein